MLPETLDCRMDFHPLSAREPVTMMSTSSSSAASTMALQMAVSDSTKKGSVAKPFLRANSTPSRQVATASEYAGSSFSFSSGESTDQSCCIIPLIPARSEEHTSELQSRFDLVCRLLLEKKNQG